jgi:hypothetical protein
MPWYNCIFYHIQPAMNTILYPHLSDTSAWQINLFESVLWPVGFSNSVFLRMVHLSNHPSVP